MARSADPRDHEPMIRRVDRRPLRAWLRAIAAAGLLVAFAPAALAAPQAPSAVAAAATPAALSKWTGGVNVYRSGIFSTQSSWLYCTAADVQMARNIARDAEDHRASAQADYFDWMRTKNRYDLPLSGGVDPAGWEAGMRHFVDDRYRLVSSTSFTQSLDLAVTRIRLTNLPVALAVAHGDHGWLLNGFTATADPAVTTRFEITSVSVTGPLWGLQSKNGYDMPPNTKLTVDQLRTYFTRWHYYPLPMIYDGTFVSIQPVPVAAPKPTAAAPTPSATARPTPTPSPSPVEPSATTSVSPSPAASTVGAEPTPSPTPVASSVGGAPGSPDSAAPVGIIAILVAGAAAGGALQRRRRTR
jgi:hypothetical protein